MQAKQLRFKIDGSWVCEQGRENFWENTWSYSDTVKYFERMLNVNSATAEEKDLIDGILEYRYDLQGLNEWAVVDLPETEFKPLTDKLVEVERRAGIAEIQQDMMVNPKYYVDAYSAIKSCWISGPFGELETYQELLGYLTTPSGPTTYSSQQQYDEVYFSFTKAGLWLLDYPDVVYEVGGRYGVHNNKFWESLCTYLKSNERFKDIVEIKQRNARYEASIRLDSDDDFNDCDLYSCKELFLDGQPDDYLDPYGLVDVTGTWYSSEFGGHEVKAKNIIKSNPEYSEQFNHSEYGSRALDFLVQEKNFVLFHCPNPSQGWVITHSGFRITKKQKNAIWDVIEKFGIRTTAIEDIDVLL